MGPAPAVAAVRSAVRLALTGTDRVLVACSGGADSLALAAAVAFEAPRAGVPAGLVTVDHGLQPGSSSQALRVATIGAELGLDPVEVVPVSVGSAGGPEAAARAARYAALDAVATALDASVLLGHTLDDQAETVLLGLGRGSGPRSVVGMAAVDGRYRRPLLGLRRATTRAACRALGLEPWHDPHNDDSAFRRVRLRAEVLPLLEDVLGGGVAEALARTAGLLRDDLDALDSWADVVARAGAGGRIDDQTIGVIAPRSPGSFDQEKMEPALDVGAVAGLPRAVRTRVVRAWAIRVGAGPLTAERTAALDALVTDWHGRGPVQLPGGVEVRRVSGKLQATIPPRQE